MYLITDNSYQYLLPYQCVAYSDLGPSFIHVDLSVSIFADMKKSTQEGDIGKIKLEVVSHSDLQTEICLMYLHSSPVFLHFTEKNCSGFIAFV